MPLLYGLAFFLAIGTLLAQIGYHGAAREGLPGVALARIGHMPIDDRLAHDVVMTVLDGAATPRWREHYRQRHERHDG